MIGPIRVAIAEDHFLFREGTRQLLEASGEVEVVGAVDDAEQLLELVAHARPNAVVVDIRLPPTHSTEGLDAARRIRRLYPGVGVVVLSQYANALYAVDLLRDGTGGMAYLLKDRVGDVDELLRAVRAVVDGGSVIDPLVVERLLEQGAGARRPGPDAMTERELAVLAEMAQGKSNLAIAEALVISESAVEKHVGAVMSKLGLDPADVGLNRRVAAVLAYYRGLPSD
jgi:DNA-binding NarL/FixJ family response regulator